MAHPDNCLGHVQETVETVQAVTATILSKMMGQPLHGPRVVLFLGRLLPPGLVAAIQVPCYIYAHEHTIYSASCLCY